MDDFQSLYLNIGDKFFEQGNCKEALSYYQKAYETEGGCLEALDRIKERYILPQEENFRKYYAENCKNVAFSVAYEDFEIDFIPVSEGTYILFDWETRCFNGCFDFGAYTGKEKPDKTFQSVLIADTWDVREILPVLNQHIWNNVYIVLNNYACKFRSFFKLPNFVSLLPENVHIFEDIEEMCGYFEKNPGAYLPHVVHATDHGKWEAMVENIHQRRIRSGAHSDNVFLSICVPSYNRGKIALEVVQHSLNMRFDAEVEILVSNNGSYIDKKEYEVIRDMEDSRVRYYEFGTNKGIAANVCNCLEKATGHFAVLFSDEESLIVDNLCLLLDYLWNNQELGGFKVPDEKNAEGITVTDLSKFKWGRFYAGVDAIDRVWKTKYISGVGFNVDALKQGGFLQKMDVTSQDAGKADVIYPHCILLAYLAKGFNIDDIAINVWCHEKNCSIGGIEGAEATNQIIKRYEIMENRFRQEDSLLKIVENLLAIKDFKAIFLKIVNAMFSTISSDMIFYKEKLSYNWEDFHITHYKNCLKNMRESKWGMDAFDKEFFRDLDEVFLDWLDCRRIRPLYSEEENLKATLRAHIARYYYDHRVPFLEIDFKAIDEKLDAVIGQALPSNR